MPALVPAVHVLLVANKTWMPGIKPGMTVKLFGSRETQRPALVSAAACRDATSLIAKDSIASLNNR